MAFDFPPSPANGQEYMLGGVAYTWNGYGWVIKSGSAQDFVTKTTQVIAGAGLTGGGDLSVSRTLALSVPVSVANGGTGSTTIRTITAGAGLTGGGDLSADRTLNVGAGTGITVGADSVALSVPVSVANGGTGATSAANAPWVEVAGDTMTGDLIIATAASPSISLKKGGSGNSCAVNGYAGTVGRWAIELGDNIAETGGNAGSNFKITAFSDAGAGIWAPLGITRSNGAVQINTGLTLTNSTIGSSIRYTPSIGFALVTTPLDASVNSIFAFLNSSVGISGSISHTASQAGVSFNTTSDGRLKQDLKEFDAGRIVDETKVYDFAWKASPGVRSYGVIAQQAKDIYPEAFTHDEKEDWWGVDYSKYVPVLLQELKALRARVAELEGRVGVGVQPA